MYNLYQRYKNCPKRIVIENRHPFPVQLLSPTPVEPYAARILNVSLALNTIEQLKKWLAIDLLQLEYANITGTVNGYALDEEKNVIGLNLYAVKKISNYSFIKDLKHLTALNLNLNQLSDFSFLKELPELTHLYLALNQITDISPLMELKNLEHLYLFDNQIEDISALKGLNKLKRVDLRNNKIKRLPPEISEFNIEIKWEKGYSGGIFLDGNPIENPPQEVVKKGKEAIKSYFRSLEGESRTLTDMKIILLGGGGVGKTSLVRQLMGEDYNENEPRTHGININHLDLRLEHDVVKIRLWDFGGLETMHDAHQLFLSKRSFYIVVIDAGVNEKSEYWFKYIESFGGDSPVIVVMNKIDRNSQFDLNRIFLKRKYKNLVGFYRLSCSTGEGIKEFIAGLNDEIVRIEANRTTWGLNWLNIKTRLENMRESFISYQQYKEMCIEENITEEAGRETLVEYLHDLGVLLHFKELKMSDAYVLETEWVTTAIYKLIGSQSLSVKGLLKINQLDEILKQDIDSGYYYPKDTYKHIIGLMQKFELCFEIDNETILLPNLLDIQELAFEFDYATALKFQIEYDFMPRSIMTRFIVRNHRQIKDQLLWRTGVVLENKTYRSTAVIKCDEETNKIFIYTQGEQKREYFAVILFALREINKGFEKMEFVENVPMPDNPKVCVTLDHLIWLHQSGIISYAPDGSRKLYTVEDLLGIVDRETYIQILGKLKNEFLALSKLRTKLRHIEFEKFLNRLLKLFDHTILDPFTGTEEKIGGSFLMGNDICQVDARMEDKKTGPTDILAFDEVIVAKPAVKMALFISVAGFTDDGLTAFKNIKSQNFIAMDGRDLAHILMRKFTPSQDIHIKLRHLTVTGEHFAPLAELKKIYRQ
ncbi:MAG: GTP-binding protein [bacterium]|nr:GTP-binding protein [bacterium]